MEINFVKFMIVISFYIIAGNVFKRLSHSDELTMICLTWTEKLFLGLSLFFYSAGAVHTGIIYTAIRKQNFIIFASDVYFLSLFFNIFFLWMLIEIINSNFLYSYGALKRRTKFPIAFLIFVLSFAIIMDVIEICIQVYKLGIF
jgi:TRAP-type C4-dicarboxylate transport system permease small subunit